jgi:tetratricopeptide (TPR) repeat protein
MNAPAPTFDAEQARLAAAAHLQPAHFVEFQRLAKSLIHGPQFQLLIVDCRDERLRAKVLRSLESIEQQAGLRRAKIVLDASVGGVQVLESMLIALAVKHDVIHVLGASTWMDAGRWESFNLLRERLSTAVRVRLLLWLSPDAIGALARHASDIWAWRSGIYIFNSSKTEFPIEYMVDQGVVSSVLLSEPFDARSMKDRFQRVSQLRELLASASVFHNELKSPLLAELGDLLFSLGELDGALTIYRDEMLPILGDASDVQARAATWSRIAHVLRVRGDSDAAIKILREELLPIFEMLGDVRSRAVTMGYIADVLQDRDELEESLRIRLEEQLPVYERLGDIHSRAITMGKIADVLQDIGQLDESLKIRFEEQLPVYEKIGDARARAVTMGKIADVLQARGEFDEALRIRREEQLPVYETMGDVRALLVGRTNLAICLAMRGRMEDKPEIDRLLQLAYREARRLGLPEAGQIKNVHQQILGVDITGV